MLLLQMMLNLRKLVSYRNQKPPHRSIWSACLSGLVLMFLTTGCEQLREQFPRFPTVEPFPQPSTPATPPQSATTVQIETEIHRQINQVRQQDGLIQLKHNDRLAAVARRYSQQMAKENFFSHVDPNGTTPGDRVRTERIFYFAVGENLFKGTNVAKPAPSAVAGWLKSPGHRENILRPIYAETGVGVWRQGNTYYITQLFLR